MKLIHYAGDELVTGDSIADAVLDYAAALARTEGSITLDIPVRFPDGQVTEVRMLIGPASQLVAIPHESDSAELVDDALVTDIRGKIAALSHAHPQVAVADNGAKWDQPADWEL